MRDRHERGRVLILERAKVHDSTGYAGVSIEVRKLGDVAVVAEVDTRRIALEPQVASRLVNEKRVVREVVGAALRRAATIRQAARVAVIWVGTAVVIEIDDTIEESAGVCPAPTATARAAEDSDVAGERAIRQCA